MSLAMNYPNAASIGHMIMNGFKNVLAIAVATEITFKEAEKAKAYLENPEAFAAAAAPAAAAVRVSLFFLLSNLRCHEFLSRVQACGSDGAHDQSHTE